MSINSLFMAFAASPLNETYNGISVPLVMRSPLLISSAQARHLPTNLNVFIFFCYFVIFIFFAGGYDGSNLLLL